MRNLNFSRFIGLSIAALVASLPLMSEAAPRTKTRILAFGSEAIIQKDGSTVITETWSLGEKSDPLEPEIRRCFSPYGKLLAKADPEYVFQRAFVDKTRLVAGTEKFANKTCFTLTVPLSVRSPPRAVVLQYVAQGLIASAKDTDLFLFPVTGSWPFELSSVEAVVRLPEYMLAASVETRILSMEGASDEEITLAGLEMKREGEGTLAFKLPRRLKEREQLLIVVRMPKGFVR